MIAAVPIFDVLLAATLVWMAWHPLGAAGRFESIVLFITFGMLMAVGWARLRAPDLALVEAALGAGLTGALLLDAAGQMGGAQTSAAGRQDSSSEASSPDTEASER